MHTSTHSTPMPTPISNDTKAAMLQMENAIERQMRLNTNPEFNAQFHKLMRLFPHIPETRLRQFVGMPNENGSVNDTPLKCLRAALPPHMEIPAEVMRKMGEGPEAEKNAQRVVRDNAFKAAWAEYVQKCQARKQRIAEAKLTHELRLRAMLSAQEAELSALRQNHAQQLQALKEELMQVVSEPVPEAPKRESATQ